MHRGGRGQSFVYELNWSGSRGGEVGAKSGGMSAPSRGVVGLIETRMNTGANGVFALESEKRTSTGA